MANDVGAKHAWLAYVYEVADAVADAPAGNIPPGTTSVLHRAIDALKAMAPGDDHIARAEAMSLTVHRLEWALLGRSTDAAALRRQLRAQSREWIEATPLFH
ncbi:hypothetical protein D1610_06070 [Sphingomonas gilva]|uniref:Uncharacterized protein n=2 Tax=Sphingomonas gilva TaxID=2305907 RepID=A0A396RNV2_9SPHN|nr:hypothetical protein D1610_06070 [Sphingomonas gilva]